MNIVCKVVTFKVLMYLLNSKMASKMDAKVLTQDHSQEM